VLFFSIFKKKKEKKLQKLQTVPQTVFEPLALAEHKNQSRNKMVTLKAA